LRDNINNILFFLEDNASKKISEILKTITIEIDHGKK
jgi:hypothetical protein